MKYLKILSLAVVLPSIISCSNATHVERTPSVEIMLADELDDTRGYCLDIAGGKASRAIIEEGLHANNCYSFTGGIMIDQAFDESLLSKGEFKVRNFDVCMSADSIKKGSALSLAQCNQSNSQLFTLNPNGQIVTQANPNLCVTVSTEKQEGRGTAVMRPISLQTCDNSKKEYQTWKTNKPDTY